MRLGLALAVVSFTLVLEPQATLAQSYQVVYAFHGGMDGANPAGDLARDAAGNLFGATSYGGGSTACSGGCGTIFRLDPAGNETVLHRFIGADGSNPYSVILDAAGNLYGVTIFNGGPCDCGVVFKLDSNGKLTILHKFTGGADGSGPEGTLVMDADGNLYGTTLAGGAADGCPGQNPPGCGTIFRVDKNGIYKVLPVFDGEGGNNPMAGLLQGSDGNVYGTTSAGGTYASSVFGYICCSGTVFKVNKQGKETVLHSFTGLLPDNGVPYARLIEDEGGNLYGTTEFHPSGSNVYGTVFKLSRNGGPVTQLFSFNYVDGGYPVAGLTRDSAGNLYGTTLYTTHGCMCGTVFKLDAHNNLKTLHEFAGSADGAFPQSVLVLDSAGNLYGNTPQGGSGGSGVVFKITP